MSKLSGKVAIVTASTAGIGFAIAQKLAEDGACVMISSRKQKNVDSAVATLKSKGFKSVDGTVCHVGKKEDRQKLVTKTIDIFGGIDILVANAAVNPYFGTFLSTPESAFDKIMEINIKSTFMMIKEVEPEIEKRKFGSIILISSMAGLDASAGLGAYSVSKTAMLAMTKILSNELGSKQIRVNCIAPGMIRTDFSKVLWKSPDQERKLARVIPLGRIGEAHECTGIVSFLVSDEASYITGEVFPVSGGTPSRL